MASKNKSKKKNKNLRWAGIVLFWSFVLSLILSVFSIKALGSANIYVSFLVLLCFILLGIAFDIVGIAATACNISSFHAKAAKKASGATAAIWLCNHAARVSNFCNDVIGDICGIISGSAATTIVVLIVRTFSWDNFLTTIILTGLVASATISGKALGKEVAIKHSDDIIYFAAKAISVLGFKGNK